jgi:hypothetical protein
MRILSLFFILSDSIWEGDYGTEAKNWLYHLGPDFDGFWLFAIRREFGKKILS